MDAPAAIQADYCNFKRVRGRRVIVLELEVPLEREREVFDLLGFPDPATGSPVAIAPLDLAQSSVPSSEQSEQRGERRRWSDLSRAQQAGIRCQDEQFLRWLKAHTHSYFTATLAAKYVRDHCQVDSRADLDRNESAGRAWDSLDAEFQAWAGYLPEERG